MVGCISHDKRANRKERSLLNLHKQQKKHNVQITLLKQNPSLKKKKLTFEQHILSSDWDQGEKRTFIITIRLTQWYPLSLKRLKLINLDVSFRRGEHQSMLMYTRHIMKHDIKNTEITSLPHREPNVWIMLIFTFSFQTEISKRDCYRVSQ